MAAFTCLTCHVAFADGDGQRDHFRSDWHRYNLMRKVSGLPPVSRETYNEKVVQVQGQVALAQAQAECQKPYCAPCKKKFATQMAYDNHVKSNKHIKMTLLHGEDFENKKNNGRINEKQEEEDEEEEDLEVEEVDSDEWEAEEIEGDPIPQNGCLFCNHQSNSLEKKIEHMTVEHSFFLPDLEYCTDVAGLIVYLGWKIGCGFECLACKWHARSFPSVVSVRQHMFDKGHCRLNLEGDSIIEYSDFYDYSSSYPDADTADPDEEVEEVQQSFNSGEEYELVLPSGAVIGHRSLKRFYKQKLKDNSKAVVAKRHGSTFSGILSQYRALGWTGTTGKEAVKKMKDQKFLHYVREKRNLKVGMQGNKLQRYFRQQNPL